MITRYLKVEIDHNKGIKSYEKSNKDCVDIEIPCKRYGYHFTGNY